MPGHLFSCPTTQFVSFLPEREKHIGNPLKVASNYLPNGKELFQSCSQHQCQLSWLIFILELEKWFSNTFSPNEMDEKFSLD
jgi:hypothetical protein